MAVWKNGSPLGMRNFDPLLYNVRLSPDYIPGSIVAFWKEGHDGAYDGKDFRFAAAADVRDDLAAKPAYDRRCGRRQAAISEVRPGRCTMGKLNVPIARFVADNKAKTVTEPLPRVAQRDNDCGIFALGAAMARKGVNLPPRTTLPKEYSAAPSGTWAWLCSFFTASKIEGAETVRKLAKKHGYTTLGELFNARQVADLALRCNCPYLGRNRPAR